MIVDPHSTIAAGHEGRIYHFCSEACRDRFVEDPPRYSRSSAETPSRAPKSPVKGRTARDYLPLFVVFALSALSSLALQWSTSSAGATDAWMHVFMGLFLVTFSMLKLFDLRGFADGFQMYDLLARPWRPYALAYPFIELSLGLGYLAAWNLSLIHAVTIAVMSFGALGILNALRKGLDLECACMGNVLKVPLSTVALIEDAGMAAMAAIMWAKAS
jgi:YHS domain-containing protein